MNNKGGLRLIIELDEEEAKQFQKLAKTDDVDFYEGIAKSLVLSADQVVDPKQVHKDIELLAEISEYGRRGDTMPRQEWADALSFTREQLDSDPVRDAIGSFVFYFRADIEEVCRMNILPATDQVGWFGISVQVSFLLGEMSKHIKSVL